MTTLTTLKKIASQKDLVVIPKKEYQNLLGLKKYKEFNPTATQKRALLRAERNFRQKKTLSYNEFAKRLGFAN